MKQKLIIGNWKMNKDKRSILAFANEFQKEIKQNKITCLYGVAPSSIFLLFTKEAFKNDEKMIISSQDAHYDTKGAFTGENSWSQIKDIGVLWSIIGHSERRQLFNENNTSINKKVTTLLKQGMTPILCVGETLIEREAGKAKNIVSQQIEMALLGIDKNIVKNIVIAYEPVWAIGTGKSATSKDAEDMCLEIRNKLTWLYAKDISDSIFILYGGSVNESNAKEYLSQDNIDGALVGGASLEVKSFVNLLKAI